MNSEDKAVSAGVMKRYPSPLRYPGGKGKVANFIKAVVIENELFDHEYVEPYAGGASVALSLLYEDYVPTIHINDLNPGVHAFWVTATEDPDELCRRIFGAQLTMDEWRTQRDIYSSDNVSVSDKGYATFYLNRTNRSGIIARGSVIGGLQQTGTWGIGARFNKSALCERIQKIARFSSRIDVTGIDAARLIAEKAAGDARHFYYLDPPYYVKGSRLYQNSYSPSDHSSVRDSLKILREPWIVSYDAAPDIVEMYAGWNRIDYDLGYSASTTGTGSEVMFFSEHLVLPAGTGSPTSVTDRDLYRMAAEASQ